MDPLEFRDAMRPYVSWVGEEHYFQQQNHIHPSSSKGKTTKWYSLPDEPLQWLQSCLEYHDECTHWRKQESVEPLLPARLIDVGSLESKQRPRLILTQEDSITDRRYVALSHRWPEKGNPVLEHIQTKKDTFLRNREGIDEETLSETLKFAFDACRWLNVRYLWVDTFCIIQDSKEDWAEQSVKMASIYLKSFCTVYVNIKESTERPLWTECGTSPELSSTGWVAEYVRARPWLRSNSIWKGMYEGGQLGTRGWCLQERQLSPRIIHFVESGSMLWECCCDIGALGGPLTFGPPEIEHKPEDYQVRLVDGLEKVESDSDLEELEEPQYSYGANPQRTLKNWYHTLADYSTRGLTYESDRPIAIQGIVELVHSITGFSYHHGIWEEDAIRGLLWERRNRSSDILRPPSLTQQEYHQIPTWSWLSTLGPIQTCSDNDEDFNPPLFEDKRRIRPVIDHELNSVIRELQFSKSSPKIILTGLLKEMNWPVLLKTVPSLPVEYSQVSIPSGLCVGLDELKLGEGIWQHTKERQGEFAWVTLDYPAENVKATSSEIVLLAITSGYGLVLQSRNQREEEYERIGLFRCKSRGDKIKHLLENFHEKEIVLV